MAGLLSITLHVTPSPLHANSSLPIPSFSRTDINHARNAVYWGQRKRWKDVSLHAKRSKHPIVKDYFLWLQFTKGSKFSKFSDIARFIETHQHWPDSHKLFTAAERALTPKSGRKTILGWFSKFNDTKKPFRTPITPAAKRLLAEQILAGGKISTSHRQFATELLRQSWITGSFTHTERQSFLSQHRNHLQRNDHIKRTSTLLWSGKTQEASRMFSFLPEKYQHLFSARIGLQRSSSGLDSKISLIPRSLKNNEGLLYDRIRWRDRRKKTNGVIDLLDQLPNTLEYPQKWRKIKKKYIHKLVDMKRYNLAYRLASKHHFSTKQITGFAESEWLAGWIAYEYHNKHTLALEHFSTLYNNVTTPVSLGRASYWAGRSAEKLNRKKDANIWYQKSAKQFSSFYGQLAGQRLGNKKLFIPAPPTPTNQDTSKFRSNDLAKATVLLRRLGQHRQARKFIKHAVKMSSSDGEKRLISLLGPSLKRPDYGIIAARQAIRNHGPVFADLLYPHLKNMKDVHGRTITKPEKALIHAITLQESMFEQHARSHAGALGLMQLMPATAKETARKLKIRYRKDNLTNKAQYNVTLGSYYLQSLVKMFDGSYIMAIAAYNGGMGNVRKWVRAHGDPRKMRNDDDVLEWIENIPFSETQSYVQRVIENTQVYRQLFNKGKPTSHNIIKDLHR